VKLAFLGTGSAFSVERYNGAVVVDGRILLDGGAPLLPHMRRLGIDPGSIEAAFVTHFHGDHVLGLPPFVLYRAFNPGPPLTIVGPKDVEDRLERLFGSSWGGEWDERFRESAQITYVEAEVSGEIAGVSYETVELEHGRLTVTGYRLRIGGRLLAYSGDTEATPALDRLVEGADVAVVEATGPGAVSSHTSWEEAAALAARHPQTRFFFTHIFTGRLDNAAQDLQVVEV
jgi:ribonuclease BN (tRNA processing enzyme)